MMCGFFGMGLGQFAYHGLVYFSIISLGIISLLILIMEEVLYWRKIAQCRWLSLPFKYEHNQVIYTNKIELLETLPP